MRMPLSTSSTLSQVSKAFPSVTSYLGCGFWSQVLVCGSAALGFLEDLKVPTGEYLLQNAANSILGQELISMAKRRGTRTINVVRRREVVNMLKSMGCVR